MFKLFDYIFGKNDKTEINIKVTHYEALSVEDPYSFPPAVWRCSAEDDFVNLYDQISRERNKLKSKYTEIQIKIELSGKLKGLDIKERFDGLDSYHLFLEKNILLSKTRPQLV